MHGTQLSRAGVSPQLMASSPTVVCSLQTKRLRTTWRWWTRPPSATAFFWTSLGRLGFQRSPGSSTPLGTRPPKLRCSQQKQGWTACSLGGLTIRCVLVGRPVPVQSQSPTRSVTDCGSQDLALRVNESRAEFIWRASPSLGSDTQVFVGLTGEYGGNYGAPSGFDFHITSQDPFIEDDPSLTTYNVKSRLHDFYDRAQWQANHTRGKHIMWTMGSDFNYENANSW